MVKVSVYFVIAKSLFILRCLFQYQTTYMIKNLLVFSALLNFIFIGFGANKALSKLQKPKETTHQQPETVHYQYSRDKVLKALPNDQGEVIMLGDSQIQFFEWREAFKNINIKNRGIGGDITKGVLLRINEVVESKPSKVFIEVGINDLEQGFPIDTIMRNYGKIIKTINRESPGTKVYIHSVLPSSINISGTDKPVIDNIELLNTKLQHYCIINNLQYIDLFSKFASGPGLSPEYDSGDKVHLSGAGYLLWCDIIKPYMN